MIHAHDINMLCYLPIRSGGVSVVETCNWEFAPICQVSNTIIDVHMYIIGLYM